MNVKKPNFLTEMPPKVIAAYAVLITPVTIIATVFVVNNSTWKVWKYIAIGSGVVLVMMAILALLAWALETIEEYQKDLKKDTPSREDRT